jgi:hypothetical protein
MSVKAEGEYELELNRPRADFSLSSLAGTIFDQKGEVSQKTYRKVSLCAEHGLDVRTFLPCPERSEQEAKGGRRRAHLLLSFPPFHSSPLPLVLPTPRPALIIRQ